MSDDVQSLRREFEQLYRKIDLQSVDRDLREMRHGLDALPTRVQELRDMGYVYGGHLEQRAEALREKWPEVAEEVRQAMRRERDELDRELRQARRRVNDAEDDPTEENIRQADREIRDAEREVRNAENRVEKIYQRVRDDLKDIAFDMGFIHRAMDYWKEALFPTAPDESAVMACDAEWVVTGKGGQDPDGIFYVTDKRLVFEQKEKTGKVLGLFGGKKEHEVEWDIPISMVQDITIEDKGMMGNKDMLTLQLTPDAPHQEITLELKKGMDNAYMYKLLREVKTGGIASRRVS